MPMVLSIFCLSLRTQSQVHLGPLHPVLSGPTSILPHFPPAIVHHLSGHVRKWIRLPWTLGMLTTPILLAQLRAAAVRLSRMALAALTLLPSVIHTIMAVATVSPPSSLGTSGNVDTHQSTWMMLSFALTTLSAYTPRFCLLGLIPATNKAGPPLIELWKRPSPPSSPNSRGFRLLSWSRDMTLCRKYLWSISFL
jgi:hypothetical protein